MVAKLVPEIQDFRSLSVC